MLRRSYNSQEPRYSHEHTPRKWRHVNRSNAFMLFNKKPVNTYPEWIGKTFQPNGEIYNLPVVTEYEVERVAGSYNYRIIYCVKIKDIWYMKSKPTIQSRPGQLNLMLDVNNKIINVQYF